jgi:hypothetical protein
VPPTSTGKKDTGRVGYVKGMEWRVEKLVSKKKNRAGSLVCSGWMSR